MTRPAQEPDSELEARLISQIAGGDEAAFGTLYERFSASLYGMAFRMMNDAKEAEDVLQEGFTYIWRKAASYDSGRSTPFAWAVMIVWSVALITPNWFAATITSGNPNSAARSRL